ncbi:MAG: YfhO family protein, partial [Endomicrobiia bacterium]
FGDQPFTSGPVYVGAAIVFLFILGLLIVKGKIKWWLLTVTVISIILSWGKNFDVVTHFFLDYVPGYNKFRTVSMILVLAEFAMPLLGILAIKEIIENKMDTKKILNSFYIALGITGLITMVFIVNPTITGVSGEGKSEMELVKILASYFPDGPEYAKAKEDFQNSLVNAIYEDRANMVRNDALRSLLFIMLAAGVVFLLIKKKIKPNIAIAAFAVIFIADLWTINRRYLNDENYVSKRKYEIPYEKTIADESILKDNDLHYRVCNVSVSTFNDGSTSFYHRSIGGYSGAKIRRYQELYDSIMWREIELVKYIANTALQSGFKHDDIQNIFDSKAVTPILNMLNAKYLIYNPNMPALLNKNALGNAWFVSKFTWAENADKEISLLRNINPANEAIIDQRFKDIIGNFTPSEDSLATIKLVEYAPDYLVYKSNSSKDMLAVFSEVYYPKGWRVRIDDKESKHFRANYVLRAMIVPAGEHTITFKYESEMYKTGVLISYICSILLLLLIAFGLWLNYKKYKKSKTE